MKLPPPFVKDKEGLINVVIETPRGSGNKFTFDEDSWLFELTKVMPSGTVFPLDFGFVPGTKAEDGDPLDVLVVAESGTYPGCLLRCRPIGVIEAEQTEHDGRTERNDRVLAVADASIQYGALQDIAGFPEEQLRHLEHFFVYYNELAGKKFKLLGTKGAAAALAAVKKTMR